MKIIFTVVSLLILSIGNLTVQAQEAAEPVQPQRIEIGIRSNQMAGIRVEYINKTIGFPNDVYNAKLNYFSSDLVAQYANSKNRIVRFRMGLTLLKLSIENSYTNGIDTYNFEYKQSIYSFAPGIGQRIINNKLTFKAGVELPTQIYGKGDGYSESVNTDFLGNKTIRKNTTSIPGGFAVGLGFFGGANYSIIKNLAIGAEFSYGFKYLHLNGKISSNEEEYDSNGNLVDNDSDVDELKLTGFGFAPVTASLLLAVKF